MPRYITWEQLGPDARNLPTEKLQALLEANNMELIDAEAPTGFLGAQKMMASRPPEKPGRFAQFINSISAGAAPVQSPPGSVYLGKGPRATPEQVKEAAGTLNKSIAYGGSAALGGAGPLGTAINAALGASIGSDPTSGRGMGDLLTNILGGRILGAAQGSNVLKNSPVIRDWLVNAGVIAGGQGVGEGIAALKGETPAKRSLQERLMDAGTAGAVGATIPMAAGAVAKNIRAGYDKTPQVIRQKINPLLDALMGKSAAPELPPAPEVAPPQEDADPLLGRIRSMTDKVRAQYRAKGMPDPGAPDNVPDPPPNTPAPDDLEKRLLGSLPPEKRAQFEEPPAPPPEAPLKPSADPLMDQARAIRARIAASKAKVAMDPAESALLGGLESGGSQHIDSLLDDLPNLPAQLKAADNLFPEGEFRSAVRDRMLRRVFEGIGEDGAFKDLSPLQAIKSFGGKKFGDRKGVDIVNEVFGSPDSYENLEMIHDAVQSSMMQEGQGGMADRAKDFFGKHVRVFVNNAGPGVGIPLGLGIGAGAAYTHSLPTALTIVLPVVAGTGVARVVQVGSESLGKMIGSRNTQWAKVLRDAVEGVERRSGPSINQVFSYIRRNADKEELVKEEDLQRYLPEQ